MPEPTQDEIEAVAKERVPAEAFPLGVFIQEELDARGWTVQDLAERMGGNSDFNYLVAGMTLAVHDPNLILDRKTAEAFGRAFDVSPEFFLNLDAAYRKWCWHKRLAAKEAP